MILERGEWNPLFMSREIDKSMITYTMVYHAAVKMKELSLQYDK